MKLDNGSFVVFRRWVDGDTGVPFIYPHEARWDHRRYHRGQPDPASLALVVGRRMDWDEVYGGHCQWVADQINGTRRKIREARASRDLKREARAAG